MSRLAARAHRQSSVRRLAVEPSERELVPIVDWQGVAAYGHRDHAPENEAHVVAQHRRVSFDGPRIAVELAELAFVYFAAMRQRASNVVGVSKELRDLAGRSVGIVKKQRRSQRELVAIFGLSPARKALPPRSSSPRFDHQGASAPRKAEASNCGPERLLWAPRGHPLIGKAGPERGQGSCISGLQQVGPEQTMGQG
jgi:hypothetical protein